ncbi:3-hydroxy-3-methylglutaryl coenzyme A reductase 2, partial [Tanacetum coccineum]
MADKSYMKVLFGQETCGGKVNWIRQRESVVCEAVIKEEVVSKVLKTTVLALVELNMLKNLMGYIMAVALGGFNAQASKIVSAVYLATLKDRVQNDGSLSLLFHGWNGKQCQRLASINDNAFNR